MQIEPEKWWEWTKAKRDFCKDMWCFKHHIAPHFAQSDQQTPDKNDVSLSPKTATWGLALVVIKTPMVLVREFRSSNFKNRSSQRAICVLILTWHVGFESGVKGTCMADFKCFSYYVWYDVNNCAALPFSLPSGNLRVRYWKWPSRKLVSFPMHSRMVVHSYVNVYQRVYVFFNVCIMIYTGWWYTYPLWKYL